VSVWRSLPRSARLVILAVGLCGTGAVAIRIPAALKWTGGELGIWAALTIVVAVSEQFQIPVRYRVETLNLSVTDAVWAAALLLVEPSVLTMAVAAGALAGQSARRRGTSKLVFNVGQYLVGITAAEFTYRALYPGATLSPRAWASAVLAMAVFFVLNAGLVGLVISLVSGERLLRVLTAPLVPNVLHWASNTGIGMLGAIVWATDPRGLPLLAVPMVLSYFTYRAWVHTLAERDRMRGLYEAGSTLLRPLDTETDFGPLLLVIRSMLQASEVELVVVDGDLMKVYDSSGRPISAAPHPEPDSRRPEELVPGRPGPSPHVEVIGGSGGTRGVLAVYREGGLSDPEQDLLHALGPQIDTMLSNRHLYVDALQHAQLADRISAAADGVFLVAADEEVLSWNPAMERITGIPGKSAIGQRLRTVLRPSPEGADLLVRQPFGDAGEVLIGAGAGGRRWIRYVSTPIRRQDGRPDAYVVTATDVTAELEAEQLKRDFVAAVSHELRTPLTPLKGFLLTLLHNEREETAESRREYYRIMLKQVGRLEGLIADLLEVAAIESGRPLVETRVVDLGARVAGDATECLERFPDRTLDWPAPEGPPILVLADPGRVSQVMENLISNAFKYSPPTAPVGITVAVHDHQVVVSVKDHGQGIHVSEQDRVFDRFYRVDQGARRRTGGIGLGLYIAQHLVDAMGGRMWLVSEPGKGSTFSFSLPLAESSRTVTLPEAKEARRWVDSRTR
jgi:PAS domain S-box-containing protein